MSVIELAGHCPSKKNLYRRGKGGRMFIDDEVRQIIDGLTAQARGKWQEPPLRHPDCTVQFYVRDRRADRDNKFSTILDCLQEAMVLVNDNIANFNGHIHIPPAIIHPEERVLIELVSPECRLDLYAKESLTVRP